MKGKETTGVRCSMRSGSILTRGAATSTVLLAWTALLAATVYSAPVASSAAHASGAAPAGAAAQSPPPGPGGGAAVAAPLPKANPVAASVASIDAGRAIYAKNCRACHGAMAKGDGLSTTSGVKPSNLVDGEWSHGGSDAEIFRTIKLGIDPFDMMRPMGKRMSDDDIWNTVNFLRDLAKLAK